MRDKKGAIFLLGILLASVAWFNLAPIIPPPGATGSTGPQGSPGISGSPGPQGSPGPNTIASTTAVLKGDNAGGAVAATQGTDYARSGYATSLAEGDTTILTVSSARTQRFSGSDVQDIELPVTSTLYLGFDFLFINRSTQAVTLKSSGGNTVLAVPGGASAFAVCVSISGTSETSWAAEQTSDYASLASPVFTGNPTAPTQSGGDTSTRLATTNFVASAISATVSYGTFNPIPSGSINLDSDPAESAAQWMKVGNTVTVSGKITADITAAATTTSFRLTVPFPSNFANDYEAGGTAASNSVAGQVAAIKARAGGDVVFEWVSIGTASQEMFYSFTYQILP